MEVYIVKNNNEEMVDAFIQRGPAMDFATSHRHKVVSQTVPDGTVRLFQFVRNLLYGDVEVSEICTSELDVDNSDIGKLLALEIISGTMTYSSIMGGAGSARMRREISTSAM